jgi:hypothetical protein
MDKDLDRLLDTYTAAGADEALFQRVLAAIEIAEFLPATHLAANQIQEQNPYWTRLAYAVLYLLIGLSGFTLGIGETRDSRHDAAMASFTDSDMGSAHFKAVKYRKGYADLIILGPDSPYEIML